jgi:hypothetical protein
MYGLGIVSSLRDSMYTQPTRHSRAGLQVVPSLAGLGTTIRSLFPLDWGARRALPDGGVGCGFLFGPGQLLFVDRGVIQGRAG